MRHLRLFEDFSNDQKNWERLKRFLTEKNLDFHVDEKDIFDKFIEIDGDDDLSSDDKANQITDYIDKKLRLQDEYEIVLDFIEGLFMDEI
jgi:hypothetical protein